MKFNGIKMVLVPRFPIILRYSQKVSLLNIFHADVIKIRNGELGIGNGEWAMRSRCQR